MVSQHTHVFMTVADVDKLITTWAALEEAKLDPERVPAALALAADMLGAITCSVGQP